LALAEGHYTKAAAAYDEILSIFESKHLGDKLVLGKTLSSRARLMLELKQLQEAAQVLEGSISIFKGLGNVRRTVGASFLLTGIYLRQGRLLRAGTYLLSALKASHSSGLTHPRSIITRIWTRLMR
jgi:tetratricopeptide (TPR) repeat protein